MTLAVWAVVGALESWALWAQATGDPTGDFIRSAVPQIGAYALLLGFGWAMLKAADKRTKEAQEAGLVALAAADERTKTERLRADQAEADSREVRDVFIKEIVPTVTLQTARSEELLTGLQQVVALVERVVTSTIEKQPR